MQTYRCNDEIAYRVIDEEAVLLNPVDNRIHLLNEVATFVWKLLAEPQSIDDIVSAVCREFDVDPERARSDIDELRVQMLEKGLIETVGGGGVDAR